MRRIIHIIGFVAIINILARVLSFFREIIIALQYGTSYQADAIVAAYTLPNFFYLVIGGAFTTAFISIYHSNSPDKIKYSKTIFTLLSAVSLIVIVIALTFTDKILGLMVNTTIDGSLELTKVLFFWMMPSTLFLIVSTLLSGILNVHDEFKSSSIGVLIYNLFFLLIAICFAWLIGPIAYGIAAFFAAVLMFIYLYRKVSYTTSIHLTISYYKNTGAKEVTLLALPILFGGATMQFYYVIHRIVAAQLEEGAISSVNYASKLTSFPQAILMTAVTTVVYPLLSKRLKSEKKIYPLFTKGVGVIALIMIPVTAVTYYFSQFVVQLVFGYGQFNLVSIHQTVPLFKVFSLSMFFLAANTFMTRFYYAQGNSLIPVLYSLITVFGVNLFVIWQLIDQHGAVSIAYGTFFSSVVNFVLLFIHYHYKYKSS